MNIIKTFSLNIQAVEKLFEIATINKRTLSKTVEILIEKEYQIIKKGGNKNEF